MRTKRTLVVALMAAVSVLTLVAPAQADTRPMTTAPPVPSLTHVAATTQTPALFTITGNAVTPGGRVSLAIDDQLGATLSATRWITSGPAGTGSCPADTIFIAAVGCVETTVRDRVAFSQAVSTCADAGRRLLTITELMALARSPDRGVSVNLGQSEWSGSMATFSYAFTAGFDDEGSETPRLFDRQFRCMTVPATAT